MPLCSPSVAGRCRLRACDDQRSSPTKTRLSPTKALMSPTEARVSPRKALVISRLPRAGRTR